MARFTVVLDESGSASFPPSPGNEHFSVGVLVPESPDNLRDKIIDARKECSDQKVKSRGFFHAREDGRLARKFLANQLQGVRFHFQMLFGDKRAATQFHKVNKGWSFHRLLLREAIKYGISDHCRYVDLLVGLQPETLKSLQIIERVLEYHDTLQIIEAARFPYCSTVRTKIDKIQMVTPKKEPLMDVVDYLIWAHQREELRGDESGHLLLNATRSRTSIGGAHRFPGVARIFTCSTWLPKDPILSGKLSPFIDTPKSAPILPKILDALNNSFKNHQTNPALTMAYDAGLKIQQHDRSTETLFRFGENIFEVLDTEGVVLHVTEEEFCDLKKGAAICCWLRKKRRHVPPIDDWEKLLENFLSLITQQKASVEWS
jgi:hypothetical protein